jgi:hypothetical protein
MRIPRVFVRRVCWCLFFGVLGLWLWLGLTGMLHFYELNRQRSQFVTVAIALNDYEKHSGSLPRSSTNLTKSWREQLLDRVQQRFPDLSGEDVFCTSHLFSFKNPRLCIFALRDQSGEFFWNLDINQNDPVIAMSLANHRLPNLRWDMPIDIFVDEAGAYIGSGRGLREDDLPKSTGFHVLKKSGSVEWIAEDPKSFVTKLTAAQGFQSAWWVR